MIDKEQIETFHREGFVLIENAISDKQLASLRSDFSQWVEESRQHSSAYGETLDKRPRFDVEPGHSSERPALRRVSSPTEISKASLEVVQSSAATSAAAKIINPNMRFHHAKFNSKLPGSATVVKWHQDFPFTPHSNDDCVTVLVFLDDVNEENGALKVVPGSHKGPLYSLWQNGIFTGAIEGQHTEGFERAAVSCTGSAGSACLMHGRVVHSSRANISDNSRTLLIYDLVAADAVPLSPNPLPSTHAGTLVTGVEPGTVRVTPFELQLPVVPEGASFFVQQAQQSTAM